MSTQTLTVRSWVQLCFRILPGSPHPTPWVSSASSLHPIWMFYSSLALNTSFSGGMRGFHLGGDASVIRMLQLADKHPCQTSFAALTQIWLVFFSPRFCICLHVHFLIVFSLHKMHLDELVWLIAEPKSPNCHLRPPAWGFECQTIMQIMWLKVKEQSDWKKLMFSRPVPNPGPWADNKN